MAIIEKLKSLGRRFAQRVVLIIKGPTVDDVMRQWWAAYEPTIAPTTVRQKKDIIRLHILPHIGNRRIRRLKVDDMRYLSEFTPHKQLAVRKVLSPALRWAVEHRICRKNIMTQMPKPKYQPPEVSVYTMMELQKLLDYLEGRWLWLPVFIASRTGLRRGEVCGLQWDDIDFDNRFLMVRRAISAVSSNQIYIRQPKTKKSRRRIDLDQDTLDVLRERKASATTIWVCEAPRRPGGMPNPWHIVKQMHDACEAAGIGNHTFHQLRHTHATVLLSRGVHPKVAAERLGHAKTSITLETYSHTIPTMQASAVAATEQAFHRPV